MPPEDEELEAQFPELFSRTMAGQMRRMREQLDALQHQIMTAFGIPAEEALRAISSATRTDMPPPRRTHALDENGNPLHRTRDSESSNFPSDPYFAGNRRTRGERPEVPLNPGATTPNAAANDPLMRGRAAAMGVYRHDVRATTGLCGRCNENAIALCYTIGCERQGVKLCPKHLHEEHDHLTLPEGVPHQ